MALVCAPMKYLLILVLFLFACDDKSKSHDTLTTPSVVQLQTACLRYMEDDRCHDINAEPYKHTSVCDYGYLACDQVRSYLTDNFLSVAPSMAELQNSCIEYMQYDRCHITSFPHEYQYDPRYDTAFCAFGNFACGHIDQYVNKARKAGKLSTKDY